MITYHSKKAIIEAYLKNDKYILRSLTKTHGESDVEGVIDDFEQFLKEKFI